MIVGMCRRCIWAVAVVAGGMVRTPSSAKWSIDLM